MIITLLLNNFMLVPISSWQMRSGEFQFKVETKLNKPLDPRWMEEMDGITLEHLSAEFDVRFKTSEDLKKLEMQCDMLLSNNIDELFSMTFWTNIDYTDRNIPKILFIFKQPNDVKYYVINIQSPTIHQRMNVLETFFNPDMINSVNSSISDSLEEKHLTITEKDGAWALTMDEATLKEMIHQIVLRMSEYIASYFSVNAMAYSSTRATSVGIVGSSDGPTSVYVSGVETPANMKLQFEAAINEFFAKLGTVQVCGQDALVFKVTFDDKKQPKNVNYAVHINTNLYDLIKAFDGTAREDLSKESSELDMTVTFDHVYDKVNEDITINYPTLTAENSMDITGDYSLPGIDVNSVNVVINNNELIQLKNKPFIYDDVVYLPLRELLNLKGITDENIVWDNGRIHVKTADANVILEINSDEFRKDTQIYKTGPKVLLIDSTTYFPVTMLEQLDIGSVTNAFFDKNDNIIGCVISVYKKYIPKQQYNVYFSVQPDVDPTWEKYLYMASDKVGAKIDVVQMPTEHYLEKTNIMIAAGEPSVMIGKYSNEFLGKLEEQNAIYPAVKVNEEYSIIIPKVISDTDVVFEVIKHFIELVHQK